MFQYCISIFYLCNGYLHKSDVNAWVWTTDALNERYLTPPMNPTAYLFINNSLFTDSAVAAVSTIRANADSATLHLCLPVGASSEYCPSKARHAWMVQSPAPHTTRGKNIQTDIPAVLYSFIIYTKPSIW